MDAGGTTAPSRPLKRRMISMEDWLGNGTATGTWIDELDKDRAPHGKLPSARTETDGES